MKKLPSYSRKDPLELGQTMVIIVISMTALLAFLALALDGGYVWAQRRKAQTAADSGALAGTRQLCVSESAGAATAAANDYAITRNGATSADVTVEPDQYWVEVTAHVVFKTFFAHLLGRPEIDAQATARAACFTPSTGEGVLPIAWSCKAPVSGVSDSEDCELNTITAAEMDIYRPDFAWVAHDELYLIMDNAAFADDIVCDDPDTEPIEGINCNIDDIEDDIDILGQGARSWLDLDGGGGGSSELSEWIEDGYAPELNAHTWVPDQDGTAASIFRAANTKIGPGLLEWQALILPVFDMFCQGAIEGADCAPLVHHGSPEDTIVETNPNSSIYVHLVSFSAFVISCVESPGERHPDVPPGPGSGNHRCPGWQALYEANGEPSSFNSVFTIEGYFVEGFLPGLGGGEPGPPDAGVYVLLLTK